MKLKLGHHYLYQKSNQKALIKLVSIQNLFILILQPYYRFKIINDFGKSKINDTHIILSNNTLKYIKIQNYINTFEDL